ncbi:hypothetical protein N7454_011089 [Penicillium verhagenii]|nr:hypothetical protein N7454_011089 [Penicillium verhagenii]
MNPFRFQEQNDLNPAMTPFSSTIPDVTPAWMQTAHPTTGNALSKETIRAIFIMGPEKGKALYRMWQEEADPDTIVPIILERALLVLEERLQSLETALARTTNLAAPPLDIGQQEKADSYLRKQLLENVETISKYSGNIKHLAANKFIQDCERFFDELETYSGGKI